MKVPAKVPAGLRGLHLCKEFWAPGWGSCWEQGGPLFCSLSLSERLEGKWSMWSKRAEAEGGASKTLWRRKERGEMMKRRRRSGGSGLAAGGAYAGLQVVIGDGHGEEVRGGQAQFCSQQPDQARLPAVF